MFFVTNIGLTEDLHKQAEEKASEIAAIDKTFQYAFVKPFGKFKNKYSIILSIKSDTEAQAHKRGLLFTRKYLESEEPMFYWVAKPRE